MKNALATATTNQSPKKTPSLPASARALLADTFSLGDEPGKWEPPPPNLMPARGELERWVSTLTAQLEPASSNHIGFLVNTMANSMAMRNGQTQQMAARTDGWLLACGALPADLWTEGCTDLLRSKTFMPSPGELMALVGRKFEERRRMLKRATRLLGDDPTTSKTQPFVPEERVVRLRSMRDSYRKHGYTARAVGVEIELAAVEGREPEDWIRAAAETGNPMSAEKPDAPPTRPPSPAMRAALAAVLARKHRAAGRTEYADSLARTAKDLGHVEVQLDEPPPPDAIRDGDAVMAKRRQAYGIRRKSGDIHYFTADTGEVIDVEEVILGEKTRTLLIAKDGAKFEALDWCTHATELWREMRRDGRWKPEAMKVGQ